MEVGLEGTITPPGLRRHIASGIIAGVALLAVYAVTIALAQGGEHLLEQTGKSWYWLAPLAAGFGVQVGLFSFIRQASRERRRAVSANVAASGGVSAGAMLACCAHHLSDVLPLLGMAALSAFLVKYQTLFFVVGVLSNAVGITMMLETIQRHGLCPRVARWKWNMHRATRGVMLLGGVVILIALSVMLRTGQ